MGSIDEVWEGTVVRIIADEGALRTRMERVAACATGGTGYASGHAGKEGKICGSLSGNRNVEFGGGVTCYFPWDALMVKREALTSAASLDVPTQELIASEDAELSVSAEEEAQIAAAIAESLAI